MVLKKVPRKTKLKEGVYCKPTSEANCQHRRYYRYINLIGFLRSDWIMPA